MTAKTDRRHVERRQQQQRPARGERRAGADRRKTERRAGVRAPIDLWMEEEHGEDLYFRRVGNLSLGGVYFENTIPHRPGTEVTLKFSVPGQERIIEAHALVVSAKDRAEFGMGLRFLSMHDKDRELLQTYIAEVAAGARKGGQVEPTVG
ncbi:MAG: PilZ domain-containing protein [Deltaproteobacteria bacterium]|nr:PilZ domain-containing protein [Deltaproteobacteria bacterium]